MIEAPEAVTILRDPSGAAQHAILPWAEFEALTQAAKTAGSRPSPLPTPRHAAPDAVRQAIAGGAHPVRAWREHRNLNQAQLATQVGLSRAYLAQIEGGERTGTLEVIARIARAFGCLIEDLMVLDPADFAGTVAALSAMPAKVKDLVAQMPRDAWRTRPAAGSFSLVEHVCHLGDIDGEGYRLRLDRMLKEDQPSLPDIDGDVLARERNYQEQDLSAALAAFSATRREIVTHLAKLTPKERQRSGLMGGTELLTVEGLAATMLAHDSAHLDELAGLLGEVTRSPSR